MAETAEKIHPLIPEHQLGLAQPRDVLGARLSLHKQDSWKSHIPGTQQELSLCWDPQHPLQGLLFPGNQGGKGTRHQLMCTKGAQKSVGGSGISPEFPAVWKGTCLPSEHVMEMFWGEVLLSPSGILVLPWHF